MAGNARKMTGFRSRSELILSLVPREYADSGSEDETEDNQKISEEQLERMVSKFFEILTEPIDEPFGDEMEVTTNDNNEMEVTTNDNNEMEVTSNDYDDNKMEVTTNDLAPSLLTYPSQKSNRTNRKQSNTTKMKKRRTKSHAKNTKHHAHKRWLRNKEFRAVTPRRQNDPETLQQMSDYPVDYFYSFFTDEVLDSIVFQSNLYSVQKTGQSARITKENLLDFLAVEILRGILPAPAVTDYWSRDLRWEKLANIMPSKVYLKIRRFLHFNDNSQQTDDRYYKIRPLMEAIRKRCLELDEYETKYSIDEAMVPYKGKKAPGVKMYMKDKPVKWGYKFFIRAGINGMIYDFMPYSGDSTFENIKFSNKESGYLFSEKCVLSLVKTIPDPALKCIYIDNFYSSVRLMLKLRNSYGILTLGTFRSNRTKGANLVLKDDNKLKREGRGSFDKVVHRTGKLALVRWFDNKVVTLGSTYVATEPVGTVKRWLRGQKEQKEVPCPHSILEYNSFMGGVDLSDMFVSLHRTNQRSHRYYMPIFGFLLDISLANAWILYKRGSKEKITLKSFKARVADEIVNFRRQKKKKSSRSPTPTKLTPTVGVSNSIMKDGIGHFPEFRTRGRCRNCHKNNTNVFCIKCNIRLCLTIGRNCFTEVHL